MRFSPFALVLVALAATASGWADTPRATAAPAALAHPPQHVATTRVNEADAKMVTWSYHKLNNPQMVTDVLRDVAAGKLPRSTVASLASPAGIDQLLKVPWSQRPALPVNVAHGAPPKGESRLQAHAGPSSGWASLATVIAAAPDISPAKLQFPDAYDKEIKRSIVWFTANVDGHVTATLPTGAPFRIKEIVSYDGSFTQTVMGPILSAWDWRKTAPFELSVRAGQRFSITVDFAPEFALGTMMAGQKTGELLVKDDKWTAKVPLAGMFRGLNIGGVVLSTEGDVTAPTNYPTNNLPVATKVQVFNIGNTASSATITADSLPPGVTLEGTSKTVALGPGEARWVDIRFLLTTGVPGQGQGWDYGFAQPIFLRATAPGGRTSTASLGMNIVETQHEWAFTHDDLGVSYQVSFTLFANKHFRFSHAVSNSSIAQRKIFIDFFLTGPRVASYVGWLGNVNGIGGSPVDVDSYDSVVFLPYDYAELIQRKGKFQAIIESNP